MKAIVLERRDVREFDQLISFYTETKGKQIALARGVKKIISKNSGLLEPCSVVDVELIQGQEVQYVTKVSALFLMKSLYCAADLIKMNCVFKIMTLLQVFLKENESDEPLFYFFEDFLHFIDKNYSLSEMVWYSFLLKFLAYLGFKPELDHCVFEKNEIIDKEIYFSIAAGGVICKNCLLAKKNSDQIYPLKNEEKNILKIMLDKDWAKCNEQKLESLTLKKLIIQFGEFYTGKHIPKF